MSDESTQHAVVFSGGANAPYEVGVLKALLTEECHHVEDSPIDPEIYTGLSLGALNAAVMGSRADWANRGALEYLEELWIDHIAGSGNALGNGLFRYRFLPFRYPDLGVYLAKPFKPMLDFGKDCLFIASNVLKRSAQMIASDETLAMRFFMLADFSTGVDLSPLNELMRGAVDIDKLGRSSKKVAIVAANWEDGKPEAFYNVAPEDKRDHQALRGEQGYQALVAATAIPGIIPSQAIDESLFFDSAVLIDEPLEPALRLRDRTREPDGVRQRELVIHVVYLDPEFAAAPTEKFPDTFSTIYRLYALACARAIRADLANAAAINDRLWTREGIKKSETLDAEDKDYFERMNEDLGDKVEITVHKHFPSMPAGRYLELLQFDRDRVRQQIERGFEDARRHDCDEAGCVLDRKLRRDRARAAHSA